MILKPGLHEPQLPVERSVTLVFSLVEIAYGGPYVQK